MNLFSVRFTAPLIVMIAGLGHPPAGFAESPSAAAPVTIDLSRPELWQTLDGRPAEENWEFADGEIRLARPRGGGGSLVSEPLPSNFDLSWEWKIEPGANTGLKYRVRRFGKQLFGNSYLGIEYQIIDENRKLPPKGKTASIYDLVAPSESKPLLPAGQWNTARVIASGYRLEHFLNGQLVASAVTDGAAWERSIALSKFFGSTGFGAPGEDDRIMLTDHGGKAVYRNVQFTVLQPSEADTQRRVSDGPFLGNAMRNSWADQDSIVVWTRTTAKPEMNRDGTRFKSLTRKEANELSKTTEVAALHAAQLPAGASLSEMFGGCPGAAGRVRLT
jgi:hypothetical protein